MFYFGNFNAGLILHLQGLKLKKQRSTGDINSKGVSNIRSTGSTTSWMSSESGYPSAAGSVVSQGSDQSFAAEVYEMFQKISPPNLHDYLHIFVTDRNLKIIFNLYKG